MKSKILINALMVTAVLSTVQVGVAQDRQRDRDHDAQQNQQIDRARTFDRDRFIDRDRSIDRDSDRDRLHRQEPLHDVEVYGRQLMTRQELYEYRERLRKATTEAERSRLHAEHRQEMQARAREQGVSIPVGALLGGKIYGQRLMTEQERSEFRAQLQNAKTSQEREQLLSAHRTEMQQRARQQGIAVDSLDENE